MPEATTGPEHRRTPEFISRYANNVQFESSVWDLKLLFGELDQSTDPHAIQQHTSVILPWQQARLIAYFLIVNTTINEAQNGRMSFPSRLVPPRPDPGDPSLDETGKRVITYLAWVHDQFFSPNPYIPPEVSALDTPPAAPAE